MTISLCIISSKEDLENAKRLINEMKPYVDEVCLTVTDEFKETIPGVKVSTFKWIDDFAAARNFNFSQATKDWVIWLDADDSLTNPQQLRELVLAADKQKIEGYFFLYKYGFDKNGNCVDEHWKAQFLQNNGHFKWMGEIHEDPIQLRQVNWAKYNGMERIHHTNETKNKTSYERNLRILLKANQKNPDEPRTYFYLGRTYMASNQLNEAIEAFSKYLDLSGWDDERYEATLCIGRCYFMNKNFDEALKWYHSAILEKEQYADAYAQKGFVYNVQGEWARAAINFAIAIRLGPPESAVFYNPMLYKRDIYIALAAAYLNLGKLTDALNAVSVALKADPTNEYGKELQAMIVSIKKKNDAAKKFVELAKYIGDDRKIQALLNAVPPDLADNEFILSLRNTFAPPKVWPKKSIAVYCGPTIETWTPESINKGGIGGSETAVIELTKRLAKMGWDITVFNECGASPEGLEFDGVHYRNHWTFNVHDKFDVLWVWRLPELFEYTVDARLKILDMHDVMAPADLSPKRVAQIDKIFVKTNYHRSLYPTVADDKFVIVGNGIDLTRFEGIKEKDPYRFCYTSSPNRGLDILLKLWPKIKEALPDATLHVYYGWKTYIELQKDNPERKAWMNKVLALMDQPGVVDHGRVGQKELAEDLLKTSFWLYPTYFPEIDCITAKEMQAAGVIPITSGYAALEESQKAGIKKPGDVYDPKWQERYVKDVIMIAHDSPANQAREEMRASAIYCAQQFSWDKVVKVWDEQMQ